MGSDDESKRAVARAYRLLSLRSRSELEIRRSLRQAGFQDSTIDVAVARLLEQGYLNDRAFADDWTRCRLKTRPRGRRLIEHELRSKGVSAEDAASATSAIDDEATALALAARRARFLEGLDRQTAMRRLSNYLLARGFPRDTVSRAVASIVNARDDS